MHVYAERPTDGRPLFLFVNDYEYPVSSMPTVSSRNAVVILNQGSYNTYLYYNYLVFNCSKFFDELNYYIFRFE